MRLNIGSSYFPKDHFFSKGDWLNIDFRVEKDNPNWQFGKYINFDLAKTPWEDISNDTADCIFASHIFEHFEFFVMYPVLQECYRVLKSGSPIRIICPDPRKFIHNWQINNNQFVIDTYGEDNFKLYNYENCPNIAFTDMFFHDHYDHYSCPPIDLLSIYMIRIGFKKVYELGYSITAFPEYFGNAITTIDNRPHLSYYLEGVK